MTKSKKREPQLSDSEQLQYTAVHEAAHTVVVARWISPQDTCRSRSKRGEVRVFDAVGEVVTVESWAGRFQRGVTNRPSFDTVDAPPSSMKTPSRLPPWEQEFQRARLRCLGQYFCLARISAGRKLANCGEMDRAPVRRHRHPVGTGGRVGVVVALDRSTREGDSRAVGGVPGTTAGCTISQAFCSAIGMAATARFTRGLSRPASDIRRAGPDRHVLALRRDYRRCPPPRSADRGGREGCRLF
jgi:hypothetical protein